MGFFEEFLSRTVHCDWTIGVESTLGVGCKGSTKVSSPMKAESDIMSLIMLCLSRHMD